MSNYIAGRGMIWSWLRLSVWIFWNVVRVLVSACLQPFHLSPAWDLKKKTTHWRIWQSFEMLCEKKRKCVGLPDTFEELQNSKSPAWKLIRRISIVRLWEFLCYVCVQSSHVWLFAMLWTLELCKIGSDLFPLLSYLHLPCLSVTLWQLYWNGLGTVPGLSTVTIRGSPGC